MKSHITTPFAYRAHDETALWRAEKAVADAKAIGKDAYWRKWGKKWRVYITRN